MLESFGVFSPNSRRDLLDPHNLITKGKREVNDIGKIIQNGIFPDLIACHHKHPS